MSVFFTRRGPTPVLGKLLSDYTEGDIIKLNESGSPVEFYVALSGADIDADAAALEAWGIVSANNVAQGSGTLTFYALSVPSVNIPVNVGVC